MRFNPGENATDPDYQWYRDCLAEHPGCETDYELTCSMGTMFDSACEAECRFPGGIVSYPVYISFSVSKFLRHYHTNTIF